MQSTYLSGESITGPRSQQVNGNTQPDKSSSYNLQNVIDMFKRNVMHEHRTYVNSIVCSIVILKVLKTIYID